MELCGVPSNHGHPFPAYLDALQIQHQGVVAQMLSVEDDPGERERWVVLDSTAALIWQQIESVASMSNPYARFQTVEDWELAEVSADVPALPGQPTQVDFAAIKARIDIVDYIGQFTELRGSGRSWKGKCPLPDHKDDSASLHVYKEQRSWWCYGCNRGSDVFDFAKLMTGARATEIEL